MLGSFIDSSMWVNVELGSFVFFFFFLWKPDVIHSECSYHGGRKAFERAVFVLREKFLSPS